MLQGVHPGGDRRRSPGRVLGVHRDPPAGVVHRGDDRGQHVRGHRLVVRTPVPDDLGPAGPGGLGSGDRGEFGVVGAAAPAVEELAVLGDPGPGVHRAGQVIGLAEPRGRIARQPRRADHGHPGRQVRAQVIAEQRLVEGLTGVFGPRVRVRVDQAGQQPALGGQLGAGDRVVGPPVTVGEQVDRVAIGQGEAADPQDGHHATLTTVTAGGGRADRGGERSRIEGGGHGWPGGPQYLPARVIGPIPRHLDATGILLEMVTARS